MHCIACHSHLHSNLKATQLIGITLELESCVLPTARQSAASHQWDAELNEWQVLNGMLREKVIFLSLCYFHVIRTVRAVQSHLSQTNHMHILMLEK